MNDNARNQTIAMAAICQAALMIQEAAKGQSIDYDALKVLMEGVLQTDPNCIEDVYPDLSKLERGSALLVHQLSGQATAKDVEVTRYLAGIMSLTKKVMASQQVASQLSQFIEDVQRRLDHFELTSPSIIDNYADAYSQIISPIGQKIKVIGSPAVLKQPSVQNLVRALLLTGVRAAVLWRQYGGKRRQFIFGRNTILRNAISFNKELSLIS
ncbi:high frequency lysogenization protein HflD [Psychrosphaera ytuae]|uniref:High frequency lysogenization protein HflD homolog n=1 Tax=Psychrosphaera ytuae TaxID=2820710 RepID=A0A975DBG6_9GAMM|nr:high frequency lysogenization protein HflD [Psychrosphaera ytuae]QTH64087.1 high frequency lysogenization protein HflD [Psychrosphaera ytuae]